MDYTFSIDESIFDHSPAYRRHVVLATAAEAFAETPTGLRDEFERVKADLAADLSVEQLTDLPLIAGWRNAFRAAGCNPSKFRSAVEALTRRALRGDLQPIGAALVDAGTIATLRHLVPMGVHVLDDINETELRLGPATGSETFELFDGTIEQPDSGEIVYAAGPVVLTRRWAWRQGKIGSVFGTPVSLAVNIDIIDTALVDEDTVLADATRLLEVCGYTANAVVQLDHAHLSGSRTANPGA